MGLVPRPVGNIFQITDTNLETVPADRMLSGGWHTRVEECYASIKWTNPMDVEKFLLLVGLVLSLGYISQKDLLSDL